MRKANKAMIYAAAEWAWCYKRLNAGKTDMPYHKMMQKAEEGFNEAGGWKYSIKEFWDTCRKVLGARELAAYYRPFRQHLKFARKVAASY